MVTMITADGATELPLQTKEKVAGKLLEEIMEKMQGK